MTADLQLPAGFRLVSVDEIDSTNAEALRRLERGEAAGAVIWARRQTAGRGRRGRSWQSPAGNLYTTLIAAVPAARPVGQLAFVAALAAGEAVRAALPAGCRLQYKWPNDLLLDGAKLGGILIEGPVGRADADPEALAVGFGINISSGPEGAANLREVGADVSVGQLLMAVCCAFERWVAIWAGHGFSPLRTAWLADAHGIGNPVDVRFPDGRVTHGLFHDIDDQGALLLQRPGSPTARIATGEVFFTEA